MEVTINNGIPNLVCLLTGNYHFWFMEARSNKKVNIVIEKKDIKLEMPGRTQEIHHS